MIQYTSLGYERIKEDLITYVQSLPDYESWKDYFEGGTGTTILQLVAGFGTYRSFQSMMMRRESNFFNAKLRSSIYAMADVLGYPVNRMSAGKYNMTVDINTIEPTWGRFDINGDSNPIGTVKSASISFAKTEVALSVGSQTFEFTTGQPDGGIVFGEWKRIDQTVDSGQDFYTMEIIVADVDLIDNNWIEVWLKKSTETEYTLRNTTKYIEELDSDNVLIKTLSDRVLIVFGDDQTGMRVDSQDEIRIEYLEVSTPGSDSEDYLPEHVNLSIGDVISAELVSPTQPADSLVKTANVAPGYHATKRRMVTLEDHEYVIMAQEGIVSAKAIQDTSEGAECCTVVIAYLYDDPTHVMSTAEEELLLVDIDNYRIQGEYIVFKDPSPVVVNMEMLIVYEAGADTTAITDAVRTYIENNFCYKLGTIFKTGQIINSINTITGVISIYLVQPRFDKDLTNDVTPGYYKYFTIDPDQGGSLTITYTTDTEGAYEFGNTNEGYSE